MERKSKSTLTTQRLSIINLFPVWGLLETLGDIVIVKPLDEDYFVSGQRKGSRIFIPDWIRNNHERGVVRGNVVVAGPKCVNVKVGDVVIVNKPWAAWENLEQFGGVRCAILHEVELLAKIED